MKHIQGFLIELAIFASLGDSRNIRKMAGSSGFRSVSEKKIIETCLEVHLFAGFPASIEALIAISPYLTRAKRTHPRTPSPDRIRQTGLRLLRRVYAENYEKLLLNMESLNSDLADWIITYGYGQVLSRRGLSLQERELIAVASLSALGWKRQLRSHVLGALNAGVPPLEMKKVWKIVARTIPGLALASSEFVFFSALQMVKRGKKT